MGYTGFVSGNDDLKNSANGAFQAQYASGGVWGVHGADHKTLNWYLCYNAAWSNGTYKDGADVNPKNMGVKWCVRF